MVKKNNTDNEVVENTPLPDTEVQSELDTALKTMDAIQLSDEDIEENTTRVLTKKEEQELEKEEKRKAKELEKMEKEEIKEQERLAKEEKLENLNSKLDDIKADNIEKLKEKNKYPFLEGTDTKYIIDVFFDRFVKNVEDINNGVEVTRVIKMTDIYDYFERFYAGSGEIDADSEKMDLIVDELEQDPTSWEKYKDLNFKYFYWTRAVHKETSRYYTIKNTYENERNKLFNELRPEYSSDKATDVQIDEILIEQIKKIDDFKIKTDRRYKTIQRFDKIMDFIKSSNIRDLAEAKRTDAMLSSNGGEFDTRENG